MVQVTLCRDALHLHLFGVFRVVAQDVVDAANLAPLVLLEVLVHRRDVFHAITLLRTLNVALDDLESALLLQVRLLNLVFVEIALLRRLVAVEDGDVAGLLDLQLAEELAHVDSGLRDAAVRLRDF